MYAVLSTAAQLLSQSTAVGGLPSVLEASPPPPAHTSSPSRAAPSSGGYVTSDGLLPQQQPLLRLFRLATDMSGRVARCWTLMSPETAFGTMVAALSFVSGGGGGGGGAVAGGGGDGGGGGGGVCRSRHRPGKLFSSKLARLDRSGTVCHSLPPSPPPVMATPAPSPATRVAAAPAVRSAAKASDSAVWAMPGA